MDFIAQIARRTGCGLILDVNNVLVASTNQTWDPIVYIDAFPLARVQEIHLGGHTRRADEAGRPLLIDSHDREVDASSGTFTPIQWRRPGQCPR